MYHSTCQRITAFLLCLALCVSLAPVQAFAVDPPTAARSEPIASVPVEQGEQPEALITAEGEIPVEEDWDEAYPYGVFAFGTTQADVGEPGAKTAEGETLLQMQLIPVYRLGGSQGRATARNSSRDDTRHTTLSPRRMLSRASSMAGIPDRMRSNAAIAHLQSSAFR